MGGVFVARRPRADRRSSMMPPRPRRLCAFVLLCSLALYCALAAWLTDTDLQDFFFKVWYINGFHNSSEAVQIACYYDGSPNNLPELESNVTPDSGIFFLETSCHGEPGIHLTPRQACAVESAALLNPRSTVYVLFPSPVIDLPANRSTSVRQLLNYENVRLRHVPLGRFLRDTPLDRLHDSGQMRTSRWPRSHASDVLRFATLWKFGGIYLDLDVVVTKSLSDLVNFAGAESHEDVAAGVLSFSHSGVGREMAELCVRDLRRDFRGYDWGHNGPGVITRALKHICQTDDVRKMTPERCKGFTVFPPETFYPIPWRKWKLYFNSELSESTLKRVEASRAIHVWNKFSTQANVTVGSRQPYGLIANQHCPRVYTHAGAVF